MSDKSCLPDKDLSTPLNLILTPTGRPTERETPSQSRPPRAPLRRPERIRESWLSQEQETMLLTSAQLWETNDFSTWDEGFTHHWPHFADLERSKEDEAPVEDEGGPWFQLLPEGTR